MKKIKSTKAFKDAVDVAFDTQTKRDRKKREYDEQRKAFDERHDALCEYALGVPPFPEVPAHCRKSDGPFPATTLRREFPAVRGKGGDRS